MDTATMRKGPGRFESPSFDKRIIVIVGGFGSGKSEVSVNLARYFAGNQDLPVSIADLDIVNPYFRSREAANELAALGVRSLVPSGEHVHADLPIIIPEIRGAIQDNTGILILDVGGDDSGARVLSSLRDVFRTETYELLLVLNKNRPFTSTVGGTVKIIEEIEQASGLQFTGIISNTHMLEETTADMVMDGLELSREVFAKTGLPIRLISALTNVVEQLDPGRIRIPLLALDRSLLKPWERRRQRPPDATPEE